MPGRKTSRASRRKTTGDKERRKMRVEKEDRQFRARRENLQEGSERPSPQAVDLGTRWEGEEGRREGQKGTLQ